MITLPEELHPVIDHLIGHDALPVIVGGYVRDALLGMQSKDIDIEVYCIQNVQALQKLLQPFGSVNAVGKSFGVLKLSLGEYEIDFSLPRTESKKDKGHRGFDIKLNSWMDFTSAARRRDFTINAMGFDVSSSLLLDPYNGQGDLKEKVLRCVDPATFVEDPLRVLRAVQIAPRFDLRCDDALITLCRDMADKGMLEELPRERIFEELKKLLLKASRPSLGVGLMDMMHVLYLFPELLALKNTPQEPDTHPEGDVWNHTLMALDAMASLRSGENKRDLTLMLAVLCHDFGKPATTALIEGKWRAPGHSEAGEKPARAFLERLCDEKNLIDAVIALVRHHQKPLQFFKQGADAPAIRRLALSVDIHDLLLVSKADFLGRTAPEAQEGSFPVSQWLLGEMQRLDISPQTLKPLLQGRDLVAMGLTPSDAFKTILDEAYEAQLEGVFNDHPGAMEWLSFRLG